MRYEIAICDDDTSFLKCCVNTTSEILQRHNISCRISAFEEGTALLGHYKNGLYPFDIVLLDIEMPNQNGKEIARQLREYDKHFQLAFISSLEHEVFEIFPYKATDFIRKLKFEKEFETKLLGIISSYEICEKDFVTCEIKDDRRSATLLHILIDDIAYIESVNKTIILHKSDKADSQLVLRAKRFEDIIEKFTVLNFALIHRTCIVNLSHVQKIDAQITLDSNIKLPISRNRDRNKSVFDAYSNYVSEIVEE